MVLNAYKGNACNKGKVTALNLHLPNLKLFVVFFSKKRKEMQMLQKEVISYIETLKNIYSLSLSSVLN